MPAGFPTRPDEAMAHAGPQQRDKAARHARLRGRLQQVGTCVGQKKLQLVTVWSLARLN